MAKLGDKNLILGAHALFILRHSPHHSYEPLSQVWVGWAILAISKAFVDDSGACFQLGCRGNWIYWTSRVPNFQRVSCWPSHTCRSAAGGGLLDDLEVSCWPPRACRSAAGGCLLDGLAGCRGAFCSVSVISRATRTLRTSRTSVTSWFSPQGIVSLL